MQDFTERTIGSQSIYEGKIIRVQVDDVQLPNGHTSKRELVKHPGAVAIVPFTADEKMVLIRQFRKPLEKEIYEIPAGKLESGEDPVICAQRELAEETGYQTEHMSYITSFYTSPGFADEILYLYEATALISGEAQPDQDEFVERVEVTLEQALQLMKEEKIHDAKTCYALLHWQLNNANHNKN
ncbi:NUDIX domain-containing protein [Caldalkalibacillus salinus]|uniref:NUDIX domain-containing protein n=1 Tax=Caldalkalibacillus salinus TaxID=2803787 RepID=UPI001920D752|nr:NUDIX hydrolase [Caldalkalibacillus salinus]